VPSNHLHEGENPGPDSPGWLCVAPLSSSGFTVLDYGQPVRKISRRHSLDDALQEFLELQKLFTAPNSLNAE
jgi:hypothetical protein